MRGELHEAMPPGARVLVTCVHAMGVDDASAAIAQEELMQGGLRGDLRHMANVQA